MAIHLFRYLYIAGLGRREIGPAAIILPRLKETLQQIAATAPEAQPVALASGAAGADQIFLAAARELGWSIKLVLPVPVYLFEKDFTTKDAAGATVPDEAALAEFRRFCAAAIDIEIIPPSTERRGAFTRCANRLVADADVLVALWDGQPGKQGGTNESLLLAEQKGVPVIALDARSGDSLNPDTGFDLATLSRRHVQRHDGDQDSPRGILVDLETSLAESLRHRPPATIEPDTPRTVDEFLAQPLLAQRSGLGSALAERANALAKRHRTLNLGAIALHAAATTIGVYALVFGHAHFEWAPAAAGWLKLTLVLLAVGTVVWIRNLRAQRRWVRARFVREINRSLSQSAALTRATGESVGAFVPNSVWTTFPRLRAPLLTFHGLAARQVATGTAQVSLAEVLQEYRKQRLQHDPDYRTKEPSQLSQHDYHLVESYRAEREHHAVECAFWFFTGVLIFSVILSVSLSSGSTLYPWTKYFSVLLPVVVASLMVLPNLRETHRRRIVSPAIVKRLGECDAEMIKVINVLTTREATQVPGTQVPVWDASHADQAAQSRAWAQQRAVEIARETEATLLTEVLGFKTFVESVEVG